MKTIQITSCKDCPFFVYYAYENTNDCNFMETKVNEKQIDNSIKNNTIPDNCPLKTESIRVEIKGS